MPLVIVAIGVALLLLLMIRFKLNGFIALVLVALAVGLMQGMPLDKVIVSIKNGVGGTLGSLALIMGFGAMLGKMLADCGGAQRIATTLIAKFGKQHIQWAVVLTGFTVGFALFYEVGFVLMLPLVFTIAASAGIPLLYIGVPMAAALSVTHGFLPPHPGPTAIATIFHADMGKTLLFGTILAIPTVILAGPVYARFLKGMMLLIIGGGGAFKQVLVDSGMDKYIASIMHESNMSPLFMAWSIAAVLRIALGSATVAAITAGGIAAPLIATTGVSPELMVIAVGSGSVIFSHVNDPGFWLFKEYFNLTIGETIKSWSVLETIISVCGLVGCLLLGMVV